MGYVKNVVKCQLYMRKEAQLKPHGMKLFIEFKTLRNGSNLAINYYDLFTIYL